MCTHDERSLRFQPNPISSIGLTQRSTLPTLCGRRSVDVVQKWRSIISRKFLLYPMRRTSSTLCFHGHSVKHPQWCTQDIKYVRFCVLSTQFPGSCQLLICHCQVMKRETKFVLMRPLPERACIFSCSALHYIWALRNYGMLQSILSEFTKDDWASISDQLKPEQTLGAFVNYVALF